MAYASFVDRNTPPIDLSEMGNIQTNMPLPTIGNPPPSSWLPKGTQGRVVNPKVGYMAPALNATNVGNGFKGLNLNTGAAMGPIPGAIGALATLLQNRGVGMPGVSPTQKVGEKIPASPLVTPEPVPNSISPLDPHGFATVDGNRINYSDIGNPLKDAALINSTGYSVGTTPANSGGAVGTNQGGTSLDSLLKTIQSVQPVQDYASRVGALNTGNTTWDMDPLQKVMAAKAGHQADTERYQHQTGALANLGVAQMNADAARFGHQTQAQSEQAKIAAMAPYYAGETEKNRAEAGAAPLRAKAEVLKALTEQSKENPVLKAALAQLDKYGAAGDVEGYNDYAKKISILTGKLIPPMRAQD
jgi:hypothetical protein